jgi:hypothetical protein
VLEGLLTITVAVLSFLYLPASPTDTKNVLFPKGWYSEREEVIMVNRILRDDPAKGLTTLKEPATFKDIREAWSDSSMWGLYFIGLIAYIPASPVQGYLTLTLKRLGFKTFDSNMLTVPSAVLQIITMLGLAYSSDYFNERAFHCILGEFWIMPLLIALITLPDGGREWGRFSLITLISLLPSTCLILDLGKHLRRQKARDNSCHVQRDRPDWITYQFADLPQIRWSLLQARQQGVGVNLCFVFDHIHHSTTIPGPLEQEEAAKVGTNDLGGEGGVSGRCYFARARWQQATRLQVRALDFDTHHPQQT